MTGKDHRVIASVLAAIENDWTRERAICATVAKLREINWRFNERKFRTLVLDLKYNTGKLACSGGG